MAAVTMILWSINVKSLSVLTVFLCLVPSRVSGTSGIQELFALLYCSLLGMLSDSRKIGNCLSCLSCIGNIIAYKAADEPTNIMPILFNPEGYHL